MKSNNNEGGIFSLGRNFQGYRELGRELQRMGALPKKRSNDRQIENLKGQQRRLLLKIFAGGGVLAVSAAGGIAGAVSLFDNDEKVDEVLPANDSPFVQETPAGTEVPESVRVKNLTRIEQEEITGKSDIEKMLALQKQWKALSIRAVSLFIEADPRVEQLLTFMDSNAFYSIPIGPVATRQIVVNDPTVFIKQAQNPYGFEIVYMPEEFSKYYRAPMTQEGSTLRVIAEFKTLQWLGLMLLHELSHIEDVIVKHENQYDTEQWFAGEVKAHLFEMNLLKFIDPDVYQYLIEHGTPLYLAGDTDRLVKLAQILYRLTPWDFVNKEEAGLVSFSCRIAVAFEDARKRGVDNSGLASVYRDVTKR